MYLRYVLVGIPSALLSQLFLETASDGAMMVFLTAVVLAGLWVFPRYLRRAFFGREGEDTQPEALNPFGHHRREAATPMLEHIERTAWLPWVATPLSVLLGALTYWGITAYAVDPEPWIDVKGASLVSLLVLSFAAAWRLFPMFKGITSLYRARDRDLEDKEAFRRRRQEHDDLVGGIALDETANTEGSLSMAHHVAGGLEAADAARDEVRFDFDEDQRERHPHLVHHDAAHARR